LAVALAWGLERWARSNPSVSQSLVIDRVVIVKVVWVDGDEIKLGIDAPKENSVHREEVQGERDAWVPAPSGSVTRGCLHPDRHLR